MGHPSSQSSTWPELESLQHWRDNTQNIRYRRPEHPVKSNLEAFLVNERICRPGSPAVSLLQQLLVYDPNKRFTAEKALKHEYFKQEPLPGEDVFVNEGDVLCQYPLRQKINDNNSSGNNNNSNYVVYSYNQQSQNNGNRQFSVRGREQQDRKSTRLNSSNKNSLYLTCSC
eukprot:TRINITY_DN10558_c0_g2_i1.p2 TRINITY_DN10558_c0_g2~~TRINITY_DN10558_c0_g2_i1.p2  ORF type:complete len:171 (-),score=13.22 TRINITY_DN10558_c0_g2_i1:20-532(-)